MVSELSASPVCLQDAAPVRKRALGEGGGVGGVDPREAGHQETSEGVQGLGSHPLTPLQQAAEDGGGSTQPGHVSAPLCLGLHHLQQLICSLQALGLAVAMLSATAAMDGLVGCTGT